MYRIIMVKDLCNMYCILATFSSVLFSLVTDEDPRGQNVSLQITCDFYVMAQQRQTPPFQFNTVAWASTTSFQWCCILMSCQGTVLCTKKVRLLIRPFSDWRRQYIKIGEEGVWLWETSFHWEGVIYMPMQAYTTHSIIVIINLQMF